MRNGPWEIKETREKYKNPWISVREDQVIRPDGKDGIFGIVEMVAGVSVLPLDNEGYVYLTQEFRYAIKKDSIEAISGGIDNNENMLDAAMRELKEETGITADEWVDLGEVNPFTSVVESPARIYLARQLHFMKANPEATEQLEILRIKFEDVVEMVMESRITHGASCILILKAARYLEKVRF